MKEQVLVDEPVPIWPRMCACCTNQRGTMVDTFREILGYGRVYVCARCITNQARLLGLIEGEQMVELVNQGDLIDQLKRQVRGLDKRVVNRDEKLKSATTRYETAEAEVERLTGRVAQLEQLVRADAEAALSLANGG